MDESVLTKDNYKKAHYSNDMHTVTAKGLAEDVGYPNYNALNMHYGKFDHHIADALSFELERRKDGDQRPIWVLTICSFNNPSDETKDGHWELVMRPEFVAAIEEMKWVNRV